MLSAFRKSDPRLFTLAFATFSIGSLCAIAGFNYLVNPLNYYQSSYFQPLVQTTREEKVAHLSTMHRAPDGIILGSSRVLKIEPAYLKDRTGRSFYNAGVTHAHAEDHVAMLRFFRQRFARWPDYIIIGIDEFAFSANESIDRDLIATPQLARQIEDSISWRDQLQPYRSLVEWQQTSLSLRSFRQHVLLQDARDKNESIQSDGKIVYHLREKQIADGKYDFQSALNYSIREYSQIVSRFKAVCPRRLSLLGDTLKLCAKSGSKIVLIFTPIHPQLYLRLAVDPNYDKRLAELRDAINRIASDTNSTVYDFTDPKTFDGENSMFIDGIHPLESNTRRMVDAILNLESGRDDLAFQ